MYCHLLQKCFKLKGEVSSRVYLYAQFSQAITGTIAV